VSKHISNIFAGINVACKFFSGLEIQVKLEIHLPENLICITNSHIHRYDLTHRYPQCVSFMFFVQHIHGY
jgi:hypothetical protein